MPIAVDDDYLVRKADNSTHFDPVQIRRNNNDLFWVTLKVSALVWQFVQLWLMTKRQLKTNLFSLWVVGLWAWPLLIGY
jgi:hypothetical protein